MKVILKDFQEEALERLLRFSRRAKLEAEDGDPQAVVLSAPTGSGKTVIATAWMEKVLEGDEYCAPEPSATFLWLTDQPDLNEQTLRKVLRTSTTFEQSNVVTVEPASFDQGTFDPGRLYFLNTQKLGRDKKFVTKGDRRAFSLWETVANTVAERPGAFWVIIDEAHKGMAQASADRDAAASIVQKFIKGSAEEVAAIPLIFGISATPERFNRLVESTARTSRSVAVSPESVRASGLLKDAITLFHPEETQPSDLTLLRAAAEELKRYDSEWRAYCAEQRVPHVKPILVVQVEDAPSSGKVSSKTDLEAALAVVEEALGPLPRYAVAHSFEQHLPDIVGPNRELRYVAPSDIHEDEDLRVVFFKRSLTTGWDCPRAEVMMSFRRAVDRTLIAQLVGRMVRSPLARRVNASDFLNAVSLYLPYYDHKALDATIAYLTDPDPDIGFPTVVQRGERLVTLRRNPLATEAFAAVRELETYKVHRAKKQSNIRRLLRLGRLLAWDGIDTDAGQRFEAILIERLRAEREKAVRDVAFERRIVEAGRIDVRAVTLQYGDVSSGTEERLRLEAVTQNVEHAFAEAGRKVGGGLHMTYLRSRANDDPDRPLAHFKLELYALLEDHAVRESLNRVALEALSHELEQHKAAIARLNDEKRERYREIRRQAADPEPEPWELPDSIQATTGAATYERHLYVTEDQTFSTTLNEWERTVIEEELADPDVIAWLRNEPRKPWSFAVPYRQGSDDKPLYPDFIVFRRQGAGVITDVLEPHALSWEDSAAKARGLAEFARRHGDTYGRIDLIAKADGRFKRLALNDIGLRDRVLAVSSADHLRQLFDEA
jgi:type III restriction enzyme